MPTTPSPVSAINSTSGNAVAAAGQAQTNTNNLQLGAGSAGGGNGSLAVTNDHSSNVVDSSSANAQSGISVALAPTVLPGTPVAPGVTTASSGNTSATALQAQNNVTNTSAGVVQVGGANQAPVSLRSSSSVDVKDTAASGAASGAAWAVANGADGSPSGVATPDAAAGLPTSGAASANGVTALNSLSSTVTATLTVPGGPAGAHTLSLGGSQAASIAVVAVAAATSGPACAGAGCASSAAASGTPGAQAASGSASATGLTAQNTVNTNAQVAVHVGGQNFSPIQVIVDSVTHIFNMGVASATSGDTTAGGGGGASGGTPWQTASSGNAKASGGQVNNSVNLGASATVHVTGDNYNPINVILDLSANLVNWGAGWARSGDAQATSNGSSNGSGSATSGAAAASGMQAMNLVNMWAIASVDIDGNNYAPIFVHITFTTNIDNRGVAMASSGNVAAGQQGTTGQGSQPATKTSTSSGSSTGSGTVGSSSRAQGGNTIAVSNSVVANITSNQISSANGSKPIDATTVGQLLSHVPSGTWNPFNQQNLPSDATPTVQDGLSSQSGDAVASGLQSQVGINNSQLVVCKDPTVVCLARNAASLSVVARDTVTNPAIQDNNGNPGPGGVGAQAGSSFSNVTPTPTPTVTPKQSTTDGSLGAEWSSSSASSASSSSHRSQRSISSANTRHAAELPAFGHMVVVDLWDKWPGRRLPPMPNPTTHKPTITNVTASIGDSWPGADELPLPDLSAADAPQSPLAPHAAALSRRPAASVHDASAGEGEDFPIMELASVDPWGPVADFEALPMPGQVLPAHATPAVADTSANMLIADEPNDPGASPVMLGLAALLSGLGALIGLRRGRLMSVLLRVRSFRVPTWSGVPIGLPRWPRVSMGTPTWSAALGRQTQRAMAVIRLTLGILRLW